MVVYGQQKVSGGVSAKALQRLAGVATYRPPPTEVALHWRGDSVAQIDRGRAERRLEPGSREGSGVTGITFACSGEYWTIGREGASFSLRDTKGLTYIQRLLQHPGEEFHALDLINGPGIAASSAVDSDEAVAQLRERQDVTVREVGDAGEMLDEQAKLQAQTPRAHRRARGSPLAVRQR